MEQYQYEPVEVFTRVIKKLATGTRKIYGKVTPWDIQEMIGEELEQMAIERERQHEANKGFAGQDLQGERTEDVIRANASAKNYLKKWR